MKTYFKYTIILLISALALTACSVSNNIEKPVLALPETFRDAADTGGKGIATLLWKDLFTDPSLQELIDTAIVRNYDMQIAVKNIEAAQLVLSQTKHAYLPDITLQTGATLTRPSDNSLNGLSLSQFLGRSYLEDYTTGVGISWEADIWGKIKNQKAIALAAYLQTAEARKAVKTNIVAGVAKGYYDLLILDAQLAVAKKNLLLNDSTLSIVKLQYTAGQLTELAIQQTEAQRLAAAQLIPQIGQEIALRENALSILTGTLPAAIERKMVLDKVAIPVNTVTGVPSEIVSRRPDVKREELALVIANAQTGIAKATMYPSLSITATAGVNAFKASNWFSIPASLFGSVAGSITAPLLQKKKLRTNYELAKVDREKKMIRFRQSVLTAVGEVSDALARIRYLKEKQSIASERRDILQKGIHNAGLLFKNGMASYIEVLTAQGNVLQSELETYSIKKDQLIANIELYRALGGGY